jgi:DNA polymerase III epsilon subunit-like protein
MPLTLIFDTETTGLPKSRTASALRGPNNWPDMVSIAWSVSDSDGSSIKKAYSIIKPAGWTIPEDSIKFHGITQEKAEAEGRDLANVMAEFRDDVEKCSHIIAHNMEFDKNVVFNAYAWRLRKDPRKFWKDEAEFCSLQKSKDELKIPGRYPKPGDLYKMPTLDELWVATFGEPVPSNAHSADRDVDVLSQIVWSRWKKLLV